ncbi:DUF4344 domain-containing metallopeptidase [Nonomuraea longicatena]|uniref:DUF4344 domain-containing metallopeptidase n=1 Tax=Nonomuraea longicatena TaxID=83682 RepID=UPI0031D6B442
MRILLAVMMLGLCACGTTKPQSASPGPTPRTSTLLAHAFVPAYRDPKGGTLIAAERLMRRNRLVEDWAQAANDGFVPPREVSVVARQCGTVNAFYNPQDSSITMCYEMADFMTKLFARPAPGQTAPPDEEGVEENVVGALGGVFYHELGHALIDLYDLPATGKEEDSVDQLSALVLIAAAEDQQDYSQIISTIEAWGRISQQTASRPVARETFADEHSLSIQRYYNLMCYLYGSNHNAFLPLVADGELPVARAVGCEREYARMSSAWHTLLGPHLREPLPVATQTG